MVVAVGHKVVVHSAAAVAVRFVPKAGSKRIPTTDSAAAAIVRKVETRKMLATRIPMRVGPIVAPLAHPGIRVEMVPHRW